MANRRMMAGSTGTQGHDAFLAISFVQWYVAFVSMVIETVLTRSLMLECIPH